MSKGQYKSVDADTPLLLREACTRLGRDYDDLISHLGLSPKSFDRYQDGTGNWSRDVLFDAARFLGLDIHDLLPATPGSAYAMFQQLSPANRRAIEASMRGMIADQNTDEATVTSLTRNSK